MSNTISTDCRMSNQIIEFAGTHWLVDSVEISHDVYSADRLRLFGTKMIDVFQDLAFGKKPHSLVPEIKKVIFNDPATIVLWADNTKTVVMCGEEDEFDPEKGLAMAISKKALGNVGHYFEAFKEWTEPYYNEQVEIFNDDIPWGYKE